MISPRIDRLLDNVDSNYASVVVSAKRARQINSYYHNLGEGTFDEFPPPMIETGSKNYLTIALEEVAAERSSTTTDSRFGAQRAPQCLLAAVSKFPQRSHGAHSAGR